MGRVQISSLKFHNNEHLAFYYEGIFKQTREPGILDSFKACACAREEVDISTRGGRRGSKFPSLNKAEKRF